MDISSIEIQVGFYPQVKLASRGLKRLVYGDKLLLLGGRPRHSKKAAAILLAS